MSSLALTGLCLRRRAIDANRFRWLATWLWISGGIWSIGISGIPTNIGLRMALTLVWPRTERLT